MDPAAALAILRDPYAMSVDRLQALMDLGAWIQDGGHWIDLDDELYLSQSYVEDAANVVEFVLNSLAAD
jgi:hypothetical protein